MMKLAESGKIPNSLLIAANGLFEEGAGSFESLNENAMKNVFGVMRIICAEAFIEPTFQQLEEIGLELTDEQYIFVLNYVQAGVKSLENFRG